MLQTETEDLWLVAWAIGYVGVGAASLFVPLYALELGGGPFLVGTLAALAALAGAAGALGWSRLVRRTDRRRVFVVVALATVASSLALVALVRSPWLLLVPNTTLWLAVGAVAPVLNLLMMEGVSESEWNQRVGRLNAYQGYGWVAGLALGAGWVSLAPRVVPWLPVERSFFVVAAVGNLVALALFWWWFPEEGPMIGPVSPSSMRRLPAALPRAIPLGSPGARARLGAIDRGSVVSLLRGGLRTYFLAAFLFFSGFAVFFGPLPAYLEAMDYSDEAITLLFIVSSGGSAVFYGRVPRLTPSLPVDLVHAGSVAVRGLLLPVVFLVAGTANLGVLAVVFSLLGISWAFVAVTGPGLVARFAPAERRPTALGVFAALARIGTALGSALGGVLAASLGYAQAFATAAGVVLVGAALTVASLHGESREPSD